MNAAFVLQALIDADRNLSLQAVMHRVDGRADHGGELRVDKQLAADNDEYAGAFWITSSGFAYAVEVATPHKAT